MTCKTLYLSCHYPQASWYAYCLINDDYARGYHINRKLFNYCVANGIVFG